MTAGIKKVRRNINGILLLNKPRGLSSNKALQIVKRLFNAKKAGHTGSLDPLAQGLLPICLGEATKISGYLLDSIKSYNARVKLGERTDTGDAEGKCFEKSEVSRFSLGYIEKILNSFKGDSLQLPPMYSALKHKGVRLYKLAREGVTVDRVERKIVISDIRLIAYNSVEQVLDFSVTCSKGTYIRSLAEDIGKALDCGAHLVYLERTQVGEFELERAVSLEQLRAAVGLNDEEKNVVDQFLLPMESALTSIPEVRLNQDHAVFVQQGQSVCVTDAPETGIVRLYNEELKKFLGLGYIRDDGRVAPRRLINEGLVGTI